MVLDRTTGGLFHNNFDQGRYHGIGSGLFSFLTAVAVRFLIGLLALMALDLAVAWVVMGTSDLLPDQRLGLLDFVMVVGG